MIERNRAKQVKEGDNAMNRKQKTQGIRCIKSQKDRIKGGKKKKKR
jgi:hypothetical protein